MFERRIWTRSGFDPALIIADEATAIKNAVARKLGIEKVQKQYGTCMLHFQSSVLQHSSYAIGNQKQIWQYMKLSESLMNAETPDVYTLFKDELLKFISESEQRYSHLYEWLEFYDNRRSGWARAFRNPELPKTNKGESGNAHYSKVTHLTGMTLDLGAKTIVAEMHVYAGCKRGIKTGQYKGGNGPTRVKMEERSIKEAFERIKNTPLTSKDSHVFVSDVLTKIGLKENLNEDNLIEENLTEGNLPVNEPVMQKQRSVLETHQYLADQIRARTQTRINSPQFHNAPHKAPNKTAKRKLKFTDSLQDFDHENKSKKQKVSKKYSKKTLNSKILETLSDGFVIKIKDRGVFELTIKGDPKRCYTIDLNQNPKCTCPEFERLELSREKDKSTEICKHISVVLLCLGFQFSAQILRRYSYNATERMMLNLKIDTFAHKNVDPVKILKKVERELDGKLESPEKELPYHDKKKYYGPFRSFAEAKVFIHEKKEGYPCKWFAVKYDEKRYLCASGSHGEDQGAKKLRQKLSKERPLVFLAYFTHLFQNPKTARFSARDEKKYFHMNIDCISNFGTDLTTFSNLRPPFDVDLSRLSEENKALVRKTFPHITFVDLVE